MLRDVNQLVLIPGLPPSMCSPGWHQGPHIFPLHKGSKAAWSLTHLSSRKTSRNPAEITNNESELLSPLLHTLSCWQSVIWVTATTDATAEHPVSLLPHLCFSQKLFPPMRPVVSKPLPQSQANSSPHSASQGKEHHLLKGYFEPACVPGASAGLLKGDTTLLEPRQWEGERQLPACRFWGCAGSPPAWMHSSPGQPTQRPCGASARPTGCACHAAVAAA